MDRQRPVEHGAGRRRPLHRPRQPAGERDQGRLPGRGDQQQQPDQPAPAPAGHGRLPVRPRPGPEQPVEVALAGQVVQRRPRPAAGPRRRRGRRPTPAARSAPAPAAPGRTRPAGADDSPTSSQPANSVSIVPASDGQHHARGRTGRTARRTGCSPRSRCRYRVANAADRAAQHERQDHERDRQPVEDELDREVVVRRIADDPVAQLDRRRAASPSAQHQREDADGAPAARRRWPPGTARPVARSPSGRSEQRRHAQDGHAAATGAATTTSPSRVSDRSSMARIEPSGRSACGRRPRQAADLGELQVVAPAAIPVDRRRRPRQPRRPAAGTAWNSPSAVHLDRRRVGVEDGQLHPAVADQPADAGLRSRIRSIDLRRRLDDEQQPDRLVDLDHLPRQPGPQVARRPVHHPQQRR